MKDNWKEITITGNKKIFIDIALRKYKTIHELNWEEVIEIFNIIEKFTLKVKCICCGSIVLKKKANKEWTGWRCRDVNCIPF